MCLDITLSDSVTITDIAQPTNAFLIITALLLVTGHVTDLIIPSKIRNLQRYMTSIVLCKIKRSLFLPCLPTRIFLYTMHTFRIK